jgi:drug/metabolite transporter (DMT)-like permease
MQGVPMELWIVATIAAAFFQNVRFMLQKVLSATPLTPVGATWSRFIYSAPIILLVLVITFGPFGVSVPQVDDRFWIAGLIGGLCQILATICVVALFKSRNFAVGIALKKTETIQSVFLGLIILNEPIGWAACGLILVGVFGVLALSDTTAQSGAFADRIFNRASGLGLLSGLLFAGSAIAYRAASLSVLSDDPLLRAGLTLGFVVSAQACMMFTWLIIRDPREILRVFQTWRTGVWVGITSMGGSYMWFVAFTVQNAAYVKALGQVELIFSIMASFIFFQERISKTEFIGMALISTSVLGLILLL